jgi:thymidine kinase
MLQSPFPDNVTSAVTRDGKRVVVAGLDGDYARRGFEQVVSLVPFSESVTRLAAVCSGCGGDAHFSHRKINSLERELVGGSESYEALCRRCFEKTQSQS